MTRHNHHAPRARSPVPRSRAEWVWRIGAASGLAIAGWQGVLFSTAQAVNRSNPMLAHRLAPSDGRITAGYAITLVGPQASAGDRRRADQLAKLALRQDPTVVLATAALGIDAQVRGDVAEARRQFAYAQRLSRRDIRVQLWSIEDAVARGDIANALKWYDAALRVKPDLGSLLFPILTAAANDTAVRPVLLRTLATRPPWGEGFVKYAAGNGPDPRLTATLFKNLRSVGVPIPASAEAGVIDALMRQRSYDQAWAFYASTRPSVDRRRSRDASFTVAARASSSQFDWVPVTTSEVTASLQNGSFDFAAPASVGGQMLWQKQLLPPGRYRLVGEADKSDQPNSTRPYWSLTCQDGAEIMRLALPGSDKDNGRFATEFAVPQGCAVQTLVLTARPTDAVSGLSGRIDRAELIPVS